MRKFATPGRATTVAPAPPRVPATSLLLGNLPDVRQSGLAFLTNVQRSYGDVVRYRLATMTTHLIAHPNDIKRVLQDNHKSYSKNILSYKMLYPLVGYSLLTSDGAFWLRQRRLTQPAFHRQRIAAMGELMAGAATELCDSWEQIAGGPPINVADAMMALTLQIVGAALFGSDVRQQATQVGQSFNILNEQLTERFRSFWLVPPVLPTARDRQYRAALRSLDSVVYAIIEKRRRDPNGGDDLLSMLMAAQDEETGERMDDRQLRNEVMTLMLAGHETTATALTWMWALLSQHPHAEARLHQELADVLGGRVPTVSDLPKLPYTRMVIEESMRLYPPVPLVSRHVEQDDTLGGYHIPKGMAITISMYVTHRHPDVWDNPDEFDPERFTPERVASRPRFAYLPFIGGPRQCIGNTFAMVEAQLILATLAQRYKLRVAPGHRVEPDPLITLRSRGGMPMLVERRG